MSSAVGTAASTTTRLNDRVSASSPVRRLRLVLADDHRLITDSLSRILSLDHDIVGTAGEGLELVAMLRRTPADCLLLDIMLPGRNGLELLPTLRRIQPQLRIVVVTMLADPALVAAALDGGARGYVIKEAPVRELLEAINVVMAGHAFVSPRVPKRSRRVGLKATHLGFHSLTPRQEEIALMMGQGLSSAEIAEHIGVGASTITFHKHKIMRSLGLNTDAALLQYSVLLRYGCGEIH